MHMWLCVHVCIYVCRNEHAGLAERTIITFMNTFFKRSDEEMEPAEALMESRWIYLTILKVKPDIATRMSRSKQLSSANGHSLLGKRECFDAAPFTVATNLSCHCRRCCYVTSFKLLTQPFIVFAVISFALLYGIFGYLCWFTVAVHWWFLVLPRLGFELRIKFVTPSGGWICVCDFLCLFEDKKRRKGTEEGGDE